MRPVLAAFRFLTRLPIPGPETGAEEMAKGVAYFPLVGAFVGLFIAGVFQGGCRLWPPSIAALLAIALGLLLTGGFHEDGASDAADGLGGGWTRERVLEIMKDSRVGAYGAMTLWCLLTFRWAALLALEARALMALPLAMALGRWSIAFFMSMLSPASQGLASRMQQKRPWISYIISTLITATMAWGAWKGGMPHVLLACLSAAATALGWTLYLRRRMGGHSGDLLGAGSQLVEALALLSLALK